MARTRITGIEETVRFFQAYQNQVPNFARAALKKLAEAIYAESQTLVPVGQQDEPEPGSLKASGRVEKGTAEGDSVYWSVSYGAPFGASREANYAVFVHELPPKDHVVGQWKYLTTAVDRVAPNAREIVRYNFAQMQTNFFGTRGGTSTTVTELRNEGDNR